jgi:hypothetical protein
VRMFYNAESFDQELCWEVSQLPSVAEMFCATTASLDPNCTQTPILAITECNGTDPSPINKDDDGMATGLVIVIVLGSTVLAVAAVLLFCYWQLERTKRREGKAAN